MSKPIVAVVGRPNVGKSTLFNSLCGQQISIVKDTPGVTRDRIYAEVSWLNHNFTLIDTGGIEPDTGDIILSQMREQAEIAIETADVIIFMTDVKQGLVDSDSKVADMLRRSHKPVILVVNKVDSFEKMMPDVYEFYNLGIGEPFPICNIHQQIYERDYQVNSQYQLHNIPIFLRPSQQSFENNFHQDLLFFSFLNPPLTI